MTRRILSRALRTLGFLADAGSVALLGWIAVSMATGGDLGGGCKGMLVLLLPPLVALWGSSLELLAWAADRDLGELHPSLFLGGLGFAAGGLGFYGAEALGALLPPPLLLVVGWGLGLAFVLGPPLAALWRVARDLRAAGRWAAARGLPPADPAI